MSLITSKGTGILCFPNPPPLVLSSGPVCSDCFKFGWRNPMWLICLGWPHLPELQRKRETFLVEGLAPTPGPGQRAHLLMPPPHLTWDEEHPEQPPEPGLPHPSCALTPTALWLLPQLQGDTLPQRLRKVAQQDVLPLLGGTESDAVCHHWLPWLQTSRTT